MRLVVECPINNLSFGNCSFNLLRAFYEKGVEVILFPMGNPDFSAYGNFDPKFGAWLQASVNDRYKRIKRDIPTLKLWHINGSQSKLTDRQYLFSFYELDSPTESEVNILNLQEKTFFSSNHAIEAIKSSGVDAGKLAFAPLGFDPDFVKTDKKYLGKDIVHFGLIGKYEKRKHTARILRLWAEKYGNNPKYRLTCLIFNQFLSQQDNENLVRVALQGKKYWNIQFLPFLKTNKEVNEVYNAIDIDLSGLSGAEGWGLPAFMTTALGGRSIVLNATAHKDWATSKNTILIEPSGKIPVYDGVFFKEGGEFNQGNIYDWQDDQFSSSTDEAVEALKKDRVNIEGIKLQEDFTWGNTVEKILKEIY